MAGVLVMRKTHLIHARDNVIPYNRKRVTATCGLRVVADHTVYVDSGYEVTCVGCKAIIEARARESAKSG